MEKPARPKKERRYEGIPVSPGVAHGRAFVRAAGFNAPERLRLSEDGVERELERFERALERTRADILAMQLRIAEEAQSREAGIFDAHLLMLEDRSVLDEVVLRVRSERRNVDWVFYDVLRRYMDTLRRIDDPYLRERVIDIQDVASRVVHHLRDESVQTAGPENPHVLLSHDLTPSYTATMNRRNVLAFVTEIGSATSHTAIVARSLNIPAIVGLSQICRLVRNGDEVILDGYNGLLIVSPAPETITHYQGVAEEKAVLRHKLDRLKDTKCRTLDGRDIILSANIELEDELELVAASGAEGIGLYRTEFLVLDHAEVPGEDEQAAIYTRVAKAAGPDGIIIRTFDVGGDKLDRARSGELEPNPFLGWRGIRVSLDRPDVFRTQLRAVLRASAHGRVGVMFPLVSSAGELRAANEALATAMRELREEGVPFDPDIEVGAMIEVPSAAVTADLLAPLVDFFSIGTNDLIQYSIAVDRVNEKVATLYQPCHPAIIRLLRNVVRAAKDADIWVGLCGEMAGDIRLTPLMVGLGLDELSVGAGQLPQVKYAVQSLDSEECATLVSDAGALHDGEGIAAALEDLAKRRYPELFS